MKKNIIQFFLILSLACYSLSSISQNGYTAYVENHMWGVRYNGETCMYPRYERIHEPILSSGIFFYKEKSKWGIANVWKTIKEAKYDTIIAVNPYGTFKIDYKVAKGYLTNEERLNDNRSKVLLIQINGKWGIATMAGEVLIEPVYDAISSSRIMWWDFFLKRKENTVYFNNQYFLVKQDNAFKLIDLTGTEILGNIKGSGKDGVEFPNLGYRKEERKKVSQFEIKRDKNDKKNGGTLLKEIERRRNLIFEDATTNSLFRVEKSDGSTDVCFGYCNGQFLLAKGDTTTMAGLPCIVTNYGFVSLPLKYHTVKERLERNPTDVGAHVLLLEEEYDKRYPNGSPNGIPALNRYLRFLDEQESSYTALLQVADDLYDNDAYECVENGLDRTKSRIETAELYLRVAQHKEERREKLYNDLNSFANSLNQTAMILSGKSSSVNTQATMSSVSSSKRTSTASSTQSNMSVSDMVNYQSLRNTYNKWRDDLIQMRYANGKYQNGYKPSDKEHAQSEMKRIKNLVKEKYGKDLYNEMEDW